MMTMLDTMARSNDKLRLSVESIGKSYEGRDLKIIKISNGASNGKRKIWLDAGLHAREWIGPSTAMYFVNKVSLNNLLIIFFICCNQIIELTIDPCLSFIFYLVGDISW